MVIDELIYLLALFHLLLNLLIFIVKIWTISINFPFSFQVRYGERAWLRGSRGRVSGGRERWRILGASYFLLKFGFFLKDGMLLGGKGFLIGRYGDDCVGVFRFCCCFIYLFIYLFFRLGCEV